MKKGQLFVKNKKIITTNAPNLQDRMARPVIARPNLVTCPICHSPNVVMSVRPVNYRCRNCGIGFVKHIQPINPNNKKIILAR